MESLQYPVGKFTAPKVITQGLIEEWINIIALFPERLSDAVNTLNDAQLNTPYRPGGWTVKQVVHHCADSHINSIIRFKLALTEDNPTIKPYQEDKWACLTDYELPVAVSLQLLDSVHQRWVNLLRSLTQEDFTRTFIHPEGNKQISLAENTGIYAWHCKHHLAHITRLKERNSWK